MNQATYNVDFPPYLTPSTSLRYPHPPTNQVSVSSSHSPQLTSILTQKHIDKPINESPRVSDTTGASLQTKVPEHPTQPHSTEIWQTVSKKRTRNIEEQEHPNAKRTDYWLGETLPTSNRFSTLMEETTNEAPTQHMDHKPPPIFISGVVNIKPLIELLNVIAPDKYFVKTLRNEQVRVQPTESSIYTSIIKALMEKNTEFHTYKPRQDRSFRVVIRNLHPSTDIQDIKQAIMEKGHEVTNIWNAKQRGTNRPLPLHFIDMKPHPTNKEIYQLTTLLHTTVTVEAPYVKRAIPQCMRCQKYGHTKNYCRNSPKCVKCAEQHLTSECPRRSQDAAVKCANCGDQHPANYRGCVVHKKLQQQLYPKLRDRNMSQVPNTAGESKPHQPATSYAQAVKQQPTFPHIPNPHTPSTPTTTSQTTTTRPPNDLSELQTMMKNIMDQMSTLINLISMLVSKQTNG